MQSSQVNHKAQDNVSGPRNFTPFVANTFKVKGTLDFRFVSVAYNEKHNLVIAASYFIQFYDATTMLPSKVFKTQKLGQRVLGMSYFPDTETFIFGCDQGDIYTYTLSKQTLKKLQQPMRTFAYGAVFLNSSFYAFSTFNSCRIYVGELEKEGQLHSLLYKSDVFELKSLSKKHLLFSRLADGSAMIYRTDRLPKLPLLYSIQGTRWGSKSIENITINGQDYLLTKRRDLSIEIWSLTKGKMRRLKVIRMPKGLKVHSMVYLENERMIVTAHNAPEIRFWGLFSGKLEYTLDVGMAECYQGFLMKDKNVLGVVGWEPSMIKIVQLQGFEDQIVKKKEGLEASGKSQCNLF